MKVIGFVGSIILFVVSALLSVVTYTISDSLVNAEGVAVLSLFALIPLLIMFFVLLLSALISGMIGAVRSINSDDKAVMITSIIILVLYVGLVVFNVIFGIQVFGSL